MFTKIKIANRGESAAGAAAQPARAAHPAARGD